MFDNKITRIIVTSHEKIQANNIKIGIGKPHPKIVNYLEKMWKKKSEGLFILKMNTKCTRDPPYFPCLSKTIDGIIINYSYLRL